MKTKPTIQKSMRANLWKLDVFVALRSALLMIPIIVPIFQSHGLSLMEVFLLQGLFGVVVAALEVPSGYLSDVLGRRRALILGSWGITAGMAAYPFAGSFGGLLVAEIMLGVGISFISGSDTALTWDTLEALGESRAYPRRIGRQRFFGSLSEAAASVVGGALAAVSLQLPMVVEAFIYAGTIPLAWSLVEPPRARFGSGGPLAGMAKVAREALLLTPALRWLILLAAMMSVSTLSMVWYTQPWFGAAGFPLAAYGVLWAGLRLVVGFSSLWAWRWQARHGTTGMAWRLLGMLVAGFALAAAFQARWWVGVLLLFSVVRGVGLVVFSDAINRCIPSDRRATVLSLQSLVVRLLFAPLSPFLGWMADAWSLGTAIGLCGAGCCLVSVLVLLRWRAAERAARSGSDIPAGQPLPVVAGS